MSVEGLPTDPADGASSTTEVSRNAREDRRVFAGNALWMLVAELVAKVASFALVVFLARGLGQVQYGYFIFAISFVPIFLMVGALGVDIAVVREVARDHARLSEFFASGLVIRGASGIVALVAAGVVGALLVDDRQALAAVLIVGAALFIDEIARFVGTVFKAFERMRLHAIVIMVNRVLSTLLAGAVLLAGGSLVAVSGVYLLGSIGALGCAVVLLRRFFPPVRLTDARLESARSLLKQGAPVGAAGVINMATFRVDAVLLQALRGPVAVGMYGIAYRFLESFLFVVWTFSNAVLPRIARAHDSARSSSSFQLALAVVLAFYLPLAVGAPFAADWVVVTLFSDRYEPASSAVVWLTGALVFYGIAYLSRVSTIGLGHRKGIALIAAITLAANVALNLVLIPAEGFRGAALATFLTEVLEAALLLRLFLATTKHFRVRSIVAVPIVATAIMAGTLVLTGVRDGMAILVGVIVYLAALPLSGRVLSPASTKEVLALVRRRRPDREPSPG
jgi:O-antigen/teichoic acid export membrane protein